MSKAAYIICKANPKSFQPDVHLNLLDAHTILFLFMYTNEEKLAEALEEKLSTTQSRLHRLYMKCEIECDDGKKKHTPEQLKEFALRHRLVEVHDGEYVLTTYHLAGAGRQLELEFTY